MSRRNNAGWFEILGFIIGALIDFAFFAPFRKSNKNKKRVKSNPDYFKITKTQEEKLRNLLKSVSDNKLKNYVAKNLDNFMTRKEYRRLLIEVKLDIEKNQNKKETGYLETNKERLVREKNQNKKETGYYESNARRIIREKEKQKNNRITKQVQRKSNFFISGLYETNKEMNQRKKDNKLTKLELLKQFKPMEFEKLKNSEYAKLEILAINKMTIQQFEKEFNIKNTHISKFTLFKNTKDT
tara:strand:- start:944 stop:1666 length:723 start_codon:yes stop_codon:yes gene_type:complete